MAGWIRNRSDGAVEAVFEGDPERVEEMVDFSRHGPSRAEVAKVEVIDRNPRASAASTFADAASLRPFIWSTDS